MNCKSLLAAAAVALSVAVPAGATTLSFSALLTGAAEATPNASTATGSAYVSFDDVTSMVGVHVDFLGLTAPASAAHIHCCTATPGVGTASPAVTFTGFPAVTSGAYGSAFLLAPAAFASLLTGAMEGRAYVNLHDSVFPGGEIRGFLVPVPEPGTYALMLGGLAAVGWVARRRRQA